MESNSPPHSAPNDGSAVASAYSSMNLRGNRIVMISFTLLTMLLLRNVFFRDYTSETKTYLQKIGRSDVIDRVIPPTYSDIAKSKRTQAMTIEDLVKNVTSLQKEVSNLRGEIERVKVGGGAATSVDTRKKSEGTF